MIADHEMEHFHRQQAEKHAARAGTWQGRALNLVGEVEYLREVLRSGAVCMSPHERVRWIERATAALERGEVVSAGDGCKPDSGY